MDDLLFFDEFCCPPEPETVPAVVAPFGDVWFAEVELKNGYIIAIGGMNKIDAMGNLKLHLETHYKHITLNRQFTTKENNR